MDVKLILIHNIVDKDLIIKKCESFSHADIKDFNLVWIQNGWWDGNEDVDEEGLRYIYVDAILSTSDCERVCKDIFAFWGDGLCYIKLEYSCGWKKFWDQKKEIAQTGKYVEIDRNKRLFSSRPDADKSLFVSSQTCPIKGGIKVKAPYSAELESLITKQLSGIGFINVKVHTIQQTQFKIDFDTLIIRGKDLMSIGWFNNDFNDWWRKEPNARIEFPNNLQVNRDQLWYREEMEGEWKVIPAKHETLYDFSGDDSSLNPALW